jgi:hypothetical protein
LRGYGRTALYRRRRGTILVVLGTEIDGSLASMTVHRLRAGHDKFTNKETQSHDRWVFASLRWKRVTHLLPGSSVQAKSATKLDRITTAVSQNLPGAGLLPILDYCVFNCGIIGQYQLRASSFVSPAGRGSCI